MNQISLIFIITGIIFLIIGTLWYLGSKFLNFGHLPGDIIIDKGNFRFYFPITTSIILSLLLSLLLILIIFLRKSMISG